MYKALVLLLFAALTTSHSFIKKDRSIDPIGPIKQAYNDSYTKANLHSNGLASIFSPRMDFDQWKPLTGRGDPLRNDPTYDYEPPVLERVHYWADDSRLERENYPDRKSEVLVLGVSSRRPSVTPRQPSLPPLPPPPPPKRIQQRPPSKYEDYTYKLSEHYPMTILVPPPPPLPGYQPSLFVLSDDKLPPRSGIVKLNKSPEMVVKNSTMRPEILTSSYALQEANLIYQSSTTSQNWNQDISHTNSPLNNIVSSDYAGWGPTTLANDIINDTQNYIGNDYREILQPQVSFYKPMLPEASPPPKRIFSTLPTFLPTILPPTKTDQSISSTNTQVTWPVEETTLETTSETHEYYDETSTEKSTTILYETSLPPNMKIERKPLGNLLNMLGPMMTMPLVNGPERPEDNLYAYASENKHVYQEKPTNDSLKIQTMQTMQPPPPTKFIENIPVQKDNYQELNNLLVKKLSVFTHDPYLNMRYTTPVPTTTSATITDNVKSTPETPTLPMYLIIQGHSKVKTYSSKPKPNNDNHTVNNEIPKPNETNEVKHLHPYKNKTTKKSAITNVSRVSKAQNLKSLIQIGLGSIEIQEADVGIKYDVSDGSDVPVEIYKKGIVDNENNNYSASNPNLKEKRTKRQIALKELSLFSDDTVEYFNKFLKASKRGNW